MKKHHAYLAFLCGLTLALGSAAVMKRLGVSLPWLAAPVPAQAAGSYSLDWWSVDGGGGQTSSGLNYQLTGTLGQPDAGWASGGTYTLQSGFWPGPTQPWQNFFPVVRR